MPSPIIVGTVTSVPPPATELIAPAANAAANQTSASTASKHIRSAHRCTVDPAPPYRPAADTTKP
jgi:hypothetical protein